MDTRDREPDQVAARPLRPHSALAYFAREEQVEASFMALPLVGSDTAIAATPTTQDLCIEQISLPRPRRQAWLDEQPNAGLVSPVDPETRLSKSSASPPMAPPASSLASSGSLADSKDNRLPSATTLIAWSADPSASDESPVTLASAPESPEAFSVLDQPPSPGLTSCTVISAGHGLAQGAAALVPMPPQQPRARTHPRPRPKSSSATRRAAWHTGASSREAAHGSATRGVSATLPESQPDRAEGFSASASQSMDGERVRPSGASAHERLEQADGVSTSMAPAPPQQPRQHVRPRPRRVHVVPAGTAAV